MNARKLFYHKETRGDVIVCGTAESCFVRYDNETGKGDHRHYGSQEENYPFQLIEGLVEDFRSDCVRLADWEW